MLFSKDSTTRSNVDLARDMEEHLRNMEHHAAAGQSVNITLRDPALTVETQGNAGDPGDVPESIQNGHQRPRSASAESLPSNIPSSASQASVPNQLQPPRTPAMSTTSPPSREASNPGSRRPSGTSTPHSHPLTPRLAAALLSTQTPAPPPSVSLKRNNEFWHLFPRLKNDTLVEDFSCAWQKEVLIQGRMYVAKTAVAFYASLLGWVHEVIIPYDEIVSITKQNIAAIIPNSIEISTAENKYFFASFLHRDTTYGWLMKLWKPVNLRKSSVQMMTIRKSSSGLNMHDPEMMSQVDDIDIFKADNHAKATDTKPELASRLPNMDIRPPPPAHVATHGLGARYDEGPSSPTDSTTPPIPKSPAELLSKHSPPISTEPEVSRMARESIRSPTPESELKEQVAQDVNIARDESDRTQTRREKKRKHRKPKHKHKPDTSSSHQPCACLASHSGFTEILPVSIFPYGVQVIYTLLSSPSSIAHADGLQAQFLTNARKCFDIKYTNWSAPDIPLPDPMPISDKPFHHHSSDQVQAQPTFRRNITYTQPLTNPLGPKQTTCILTDTVLHHTRYHSCLEQISQTPSVPSGGSFQARIHICLTDNAVDGGSGPEEATAVWVGAKVEWTGSSWIKGVVEGAVMEGLKEFWSGMSQWMSDLTKMRPFVDGLAAVAAPTATDTMSTSPVSDDTGASWSESDDGHEPHVDDGDSVAKGAQLLGFSTPVTSPLSHPLEPELIALEQAPVRHRHFHHHKPTPLTVTPASTSKRLGYSMPILRVNSQILLGMIFCSSVAILTFAYALRWWIRHEVRRALEEAGCGNGSKVGT
ncbi:hypothetical protein BC832DRAFT_537225 [Gaertneriomyces semiglobifer]|nr:hypothetical protein BC832DRAFT_537225 [Gaertneriomyces semiglobifer]